MLGTRGCRLGILKPGLYRMQVRALMQAAVTRKQRGGDPIVEIMIPLIVSEPELDAARAAGCARRPTTVLRRRRASSVDYLVGTMIETPRAALVADEIAEVAEFFSFGTNDLTQMTFGFSPRRRRGPLHGRVPRAQAAAGQPVRDARPSRASASSCAWACEQGRATRPDIKLGICGEHGGDPGVGARSATRSASTTCRARRTACRSPASPPRTPRSASGPGTTA